ncbi:UDP-glucose 6-dehydrogenase [Skermanella aerolata]|uniref:UDP-glucose 6-dehydrogenase n=1 Tax=Skermanella aerolata TaxID=393310 RepID=A0A512E2N1_9PROT|nr:nucleotide sugar dehydrogenase [Skermanella aerolata]KJB90250.1 hypothetical protein N826_36785 [Skermanella aerolata KACC 11604]GEO42988.1 UDP-glucose 6-dehydrogenase [Skermanella aerolata]
MSNPVIGYAGMTHLGINSAAAAAARGFDVICFDTDPARIFSLARHVLPVVEPELPELFAEFGERLRFTSDPAALAECDVIYVAPDVPTDDRGNSNLAPVRALVEIVDGAMRSGAALVVLSQVPPGFTRSLARAKTHLFYQVETLIFGRAVERARFPERFMVGTVDPKASLPPALATFLAAFDCPILPMRYESAELAKISINMCLVAMVSTANTLAELCEKVGADWSEIVPSLKLDKRIGPYSYLAPGLGIAGGNLERDLTTVIALADQHGTDPRMVQSWVANSMYRRDWVLSQLHERILANVHDPLISVLGLAYKQDTHSTKNSPSLALLSGLGPFRVKAYDPVVAVDPTFHPCIQAASSALSVCDGADVLVIMTPWSEFKALSPSEIAERLRGRTVIDPYAVLDADACRNAGLVYVTLGVAS